MNIQRMTLDIGKPTERMQNVFVATGDRSGCTLGVTILDNGIPVDMSGMEAELVMRLSTGDALAFAASAASFEATFTIDEAQLTGTVEFAYVTLSDSGRVYSTDRFGITVIPGNNSEE